MHDRQSGIFPEGPSGHFPWPLIHRAQAGGHDNGLPRAEPVLGGVGGSETGKRPECRVGLCPEAGSRENV